MYSREGRKGLHDNLRVNMNILIGLMKNPSINRSVEFNYNKLSLYSAQKGKCAITQRIFCTTEEIHCHHKKPKSLGGTDEYKNLMLVLEPVHRLIHAKSQMEINKYLNCLQLTNTQLAKVNKYREMAGNEPIVA